jgi:ribosome-binding factor A
MRDPRMRAVTITHIRLSPDLRQAFIRFTLLEAEGGDREGALRALEHAEPFFRRHLAEELELRFTPELRFAYDSQLESARRIDSLLRGIRAERGEDEE